MGIFFSFFGKYLQHSLEETKLAIMLSLEKEGFAHSVFYLLSFQVALHYIPQETYSPDLAYVVPTKT